jgi:hypothetical protein
MTLPTARYDSGSLFWRGSNPTFTFIRYEDAETLLETFKQQVFLGDQGCPGWKDRCEDYVRDLTGALDDFDHELSELEMEQPL